MASLDTLRLPKPKFQEPSSVQLHATGIGRLLSDYSEFGGSTYDDRISNYGDTDNTSPPLSSNFYGNSKDSDSPPTKFGTLNAEASKPSVFFDSSITDTSDSEVAWSKHSVIKPNTSLKNVSTVSTKTPSSCETVNKSLSQVSEPGSEESESESQTSSSCETVNKSMTGQAPPIQLIDSDGFLQYSAEDGHDNGLGSVDPNLGFSEIQFPGHYDTEDFELIQNLRENHNQGYNTKEAEPLYLDESINTVTKKNLTKDDEKKTESEPDVKTLSEDINDSESDCEEQPECKMDSQGFLEYDGTLGAADSNLGGSLIQFPSHYDDDEPVDGLQEPVDALQEPAEWKPKAKGEELKKGDTDSHRESPSESDVQNHDIENPESMHGDSDKSEEKSHHEMERPEGEDSGDNKESEFNFDSEPETIPLIPRTPSITVTKPSDCEAPHSDRQAPQSHCQASSSPQLGPGNTNSSEGCIPSLTSLPSCRSSFSSDGSRDSVDSDMGSMGSESETSEPGSSSQPGSSGTNLVSLSPQLSPITKTLTTNSLQVPSCYPEGKRRISRLSKLSSLRSNWSTRSKRESRQTCGGGKETTFRVIQIVLGCIVAVLLIALGALEIEQRTRCGCLKCFMQ